MTAEEENTNLKAELAAIRESLEVPEDEDTLEFIERMRKWELS